MPDVMKAGLAMYITSWILSFAIGFTNGTLIHPQVSKDAVMGLVGIGCFSAILIPVFILGLIMACLGREWGCILMTCANIISLILTLAMGLVWDIFLTNLFYILVNILGIVSWACFLAPSAWDYYEQSDAYRKSKNIVFVSEGLYR
jgi:hypothetical protein